MCATSWNWETGRWSCSFSGCDERANRSLANFCARCGRSPAAKSVDLSAAIGVSESAQPRSLNPAVDGLEGVSHLLNVFGTAVLANFEASSFLVYADPRSVLRGFPLPAPSKPLREIAFDRWWLYALDREGDLSIFPTLALSAGEVAQAHPWRRLATGVQAMCVRDQGLFLLDAGGRQARVAVMDRLSYDRLLFEGPPFTDADFQTVRLPTAFSKILPVHGTPATAALIGANDVMFLTSEGESLHNQHFREEEETCWTAVQRDRRTRLASLTAEGRVKIQLFLDSERPVVDEIQEFQHPVSALTVPYIDRQAWFAAVTPEGLALIDPLDRHPKGRWEALHGSVMTHPDQSLSWGHLTAVFLKRVGSSLTQLWVVQASDRDLRAPRHWDLPSDCLPATRPAGFGKTLYLVTRDASREKFALNCYDLR